MNQNQYVDTTGPLVAELLTNPHSLPAPYTDIMMSDTLYDKLKRDIYGTP